MSNLYANCQALEPILGTLTTRSYVVTSKCSSTTPYLKCVAPKSIKFDSLTVTLPAFRSCIADSQVCKVIKSHILAQICTGM